MANHKSAIKRNKQNEVRRLRNRNQKVRMRTFIKKFREAETAGDVVAARASLAVAVKLIGSTRSRGAIHRNTEARLVGRLQVAFNKLEAAQAGN